MKKLKFIFIFFLLIGGCRNKKNQEKKENLILIDIELVGVMDTITAIVKGSISDLKDTNLLSYSKIEIGNYKLISDTLGRFNFFHISAGRYPVKVNYNNCTFLASDSLYIETGDILRLKIRIHCIK